MTLLEFRLKFYSRLSVVAPTMLYVFTDEDSANSWIEYKYFSNTDCSYKLEFILLTDTIAKYSLPEKWCKAEVQNFYAVAPDVIVIVVEPYKESEAT